MRTITINNIDYTKHLINGYVTNETLTEELDSANIILTGLPKTNFDPFDNVTINENGNYYYLVVDTYVERKVANNPELFEYQIHLISETKVLERFILPNLKITKQTYENNNHKMGNYLAHILDHYTRNKYYLELDSNLKKELNKVNVPEWAWARPTIKQVFNDMLQTLDQPKLVKVNNHIVSAVELSIKGNEINLKKGEIEDNNYQSSNDYINHLLVDAKNILPNEANVMTAPALSPRENDKFRLDDTISSFQFQNAKIEKFNKVILSQPLKFIYSGNNGSKDETIDFDITNYIVEETLYNLMLPEEKAKHLYYSRGGNSINGLRFKDLTYEAINYIIRTETAELNKKVGGGQYDLPINVDVRALRLTAWYQNIGESAIKVYRDDPKKYDFETQDNQTSTFINTLSFMQAEREKVNRIGNDIRTITWLIKNYDDIPHLNDYIGDYYLASKETAHYGYYYVVKGVLSKDYIQKNKYYGIQSRARFTNFELANNSVLRNENIVTNLYFTTENTQPSGTSKRKLVTYIARNYSDVLNRNGDIIAKSIKQIKATSTFNDKTTKQYFLQPTIHAFDKGVIVSLKYYDNINVGMEVHHVESVWGDTFSQSYVSYVDNNGELTSLKFELYSRYNDKYLTANGKIQDFTETNTYPAYFEGYLNEDYNEILIQDYIYKDNGEILQYDLQFNFIGQNGVVLGNAIGRYNAIADITSETAENYTRASKSKLLNLKVYYSTTETYGQYDNVAKGVYDASLKIDDHTYIAWDNGILNNSIHLSRYIEEDDIYVNVDTSTWKSWCIATENDELIMAVNRNETTNILSDTIYVTTD